MYVVFGGSGQTGSAAADALLEKKLPVCVVLRSDKTADWRANSAKYKISRLIDSEKTK